MKKKKPFSRDNILGPEEIKKLLLACKTKREKLLIFSLLYTGMRISEFLHFKRSWLSYNKDMITIPLKQECRCYECKHKGKIWKPKTEYGNRTIPILNECKDIILSYFSEHEAIKETIPNRVFAWEYIKKMGRRAKIGHKVFPHAIRATFATLLAEKGFDVLEITHVMGWKSPEMAMTYIRLSGQKLKEEFDKKW